MSRFSEFWEEWPKASDKGYSEYKRRADKRKCEEKWERFKLDSVAEVILHDVRQRKRYDKAWRESHGKYLSAPLVYLNNRRWEDGEFADVRDKREHAGPSASPLSVPEVRRGAIALMLKRYSPEVIQKTFGLTEAEFEELRRDERVYTMPPLLPGDKLVGL